MDFNTFDLHPKVTAGVTAQGFTTPTPIQAQAIPTVMEGRDVMGLAQTGTGKTAAFVLPILNRLMTGKRGVISALIVAPTRELAEQINDTIVSLGRQTGVRSTTVYGGVGINPQIAKLRGGTEIVVACPGRLLDHIGRGTVNLSKVETLVLDEADQMFDMGFLPAIRQIMRKLPASRQNLLFSATMPQEIRRLAGEILNNPETVQVDTLAPAVTVSHAIFPVEQHRKTAMLLELLSRTDTGPVLVFTRTKHRAKRLGQQLEKAGHRAASIQGNLSQNRRQAALNGFKTGTYQILVATDIAARGIDVSKVSHVINYDIPNTTDAYIHRIGRTGRAASTGDAYTLVTGEDRGTVRAIERVLGAPLERRTIEDFDYNVPAPKKDREFARPPRQPRRQAPGRKPAGPKRSGASGGGAAPSGPRPSRPSGRKPATPGGTPQRSRRSRRPAVA